MTTFITRVELHNATYKDYETLHAAMAQEGYSRQIRGDDGAIYWLPPAEYSLSADCTIEAARTRARKAADTTKKSSAVFVSQYSAAAWIGLEKVEVKKYA